MSKSQLRRGSMKATDIEIRTAYGKTKSVHGAGRLLGMCGQSVHERLKKMNVQMDRRLSECDKEIVRREYEHYANQGKLKELASKLGRTKHFICRHARLLGLTNRIEGKPWNRVWKGMSTDDAKRWFDRFRASDQSVEQWCISQGIDDLGFARTMKEHFPDEWELLMEDRHVTENYRAGRRVEFAIMNHLQQRRYHVLRAVRSRGVVDVIALKHGVMFCVQVKKEMTVCGVKEWNKLYKLANSINALPVIAGMLNGTIAFARILKHKTGEKSRQPMEVFEP